MPYVCAVTLSNIDFQRVEEVGLIRQSTMIVVLELCMFFRFIKFRISFEFSSQFAEVQCCSPKFIKDERASTQRS